MNLAIIGSGNIAKEFLQVVQEVPEIGVVALCGTERSRATVEQLQNTYGIPYGFTDIDELLTYSSTDYEQDSGKASKEATKGQDSIDAVYIAVPNHLHYEIAKRVLLADKHVILEKPFTTTYQEAEELIALAEERELIIFEAISNQFLPNYLTTETLLDTLGEIRIVELNFSQFSSRYRRFQEGERHPVFDLTKAGGTLGDLNVYNIYFLVGLFGEPQDVVYYPNMERGIDTSGVLVMQYDSFVAVAIAAKDSSGGLSVSIQGNRGAIISHSAPNAYEEFIHHIYGAEPVVYEKNQGRHRLYYEIIKFYDLVDQGNLSEAKLLNQRALMVMRVLDKARGALG